MKRILKLAILLNIFLCINLFAAKNLYLSNSYPSGKMTEYLFKNIFSNNDFLANIQIYKFQNEVIEDVEEFFLWLGVNKYTKFNKINSDSNYEKFIFTKIDKPLAYRDSSFQFHKGTIRTYC
mgnify:CR=1 FL=1